MRKYDLLYIAFIDLGDSATSGSSVRPKMMLEAFRSLGLKIKVLDGWNNQLKLRRQNVSEVLKWLSSNTPRMCYIEPPSGPLFNSIDLKLIRILKKMKIPTAIFYRDAFYLFPEIYSRDSFKYNIINKVKLLIIKIMEKRDLKVFINNIDWFFFPSKSFGETLNLNVLWEDLPPGSVVYKNRREFSAEESILSNKKSINFMYVGGLSKLYGTEIMLESMKRLNQEVYAKLILVCRESEWGDYKKQYENEKWLNVYHVNAQTGLHRLYDEADICLIPFEKTAYMDFAMPIKLMEYVSNNKPILSTNCNEIKRFIIKWQIGWVVKADIENYTNKLFELINNRQDIIVKKKNTFIAATENTWKKRAEKVIKALSNL